ncbi:MAG: DUF5362 family protein [Acidimicrobiia bacterium]
MSTESYLPSSGDTATVEISRPLYEARGWMKLIAVMGFVYGGITAITIVGIIVAWLPIWAGVLLWQAATAAEGAHRMGIGPG